MEDHGLVFFSKNFKKIIMSRVPNTKLSDQWEKKKVEHVSNLIFQKLYTFVYTIKKTLWQVQNFVLIFILHQWQESIPTIIYILSSRLVRHHIVKKMFKMVSSYHQVWKEACSFLEFTLWNNPSHKVTLNPKPKIVVGCKSQLMWCSWF
jgi:hypothetical protein